MVNIALVGSGHIAKLHAETLRSIEGARIVSVYDVDFHRAAALAGAVGAHAYTDLDACMKQADLVYILTPPSFHRDIAVAAMEDGKHVMIEKPISISLRDAEDICETAARLNRKAMVGFNMRFRYGYGLLKSMIDGGRLGEPMTYWSHRMGYVGGDGTWRTNASLMSGFTIESISHDIDMFRWLSGSEVDRVYGHTANSRADLPGYDDNCAALLRLANGQTASIQASWSSYLEYNDRGVTGSDGTARIGGSGTWNFDTFAYRTRGEAAETVERFDDRLTAEAYVGLNAHAIDCVKNGTTPLVSAEDGYRALRVCHAILQSHREGRPVSLHE